MAGIDTAAPRFREGVDYLMKLTAVQNSFPGVL
jgi:hypothetical protein